MSQERSRDDYKVAWICPLEVEQIAAMEMLDEEHPALPKSSADHNVYSLGSINGHNIVIAGLHQPGNCPAATVVAQMRMTFPNLRFGLLVGIGGGVPVQTDNGMIRLGHVVVSKPAGGHSGALQGNIASGELVVKDALLRDTLAQQDGLLCFEMEAAGAIADFPCLVVRGISDYCDSHKNDMWHGDATGTASPSFILPFKLPGVNSVNYFVARHEELGRLHEELKWTGQRRTVVLHGLGGMGKTQTTIAFAKKHGDDYSAVLWLDARDTTALKQSYQRLAQRIVRETASLPYVQNAIDNEDLDGIVESAKRWLDEPKNNRWLVIYDNYDDVLLDSHITTNQSVRCAAEMAPISGKTSQAEAASSKAYDIRPYLPETDHGAVIITTRSATVKLGQLIRLSKLGDISDSLAIVASTSGRDHFSKVQRRLLQHADQCIIKVATSAEPETKEWMFDSFGNLYSDQGRLKEAEAMYERALQGKEKALGPDHTSTLNTVNNLGILYKDQGRLKEAEAMYERALQGKDVTG
ncbi:hypothetical protein K4K60_012077 [Colletotrichum sp. SAR11_57]|nr:hypothetical protein K4K60_012077 [Colletotrichum sp. SAR11_57]